MLYIRYQMSIAVHVSAFKLNLNQTHISLRFICPHRPSTDLSSTLDWLYDAIRDQDILSCLMR